MLTDDVLSPRRTTRKVVDPLRDRRDSIIPGDLILVDVSAYLEGGGERWCKFAFDSPGSAAVYPYKAHVPERGIGQWKAAEILAWARPVELHETLREIAASHPA